VLSAIERKSGLRSRVLLRDTPDEPSPLLKVHPPGSEEGAEDDSRYQVAGEIARGGVGVIFKGRDRDLGRDVALKVLRKELVTSPEILQRFVEEAQVEGQLQHPGIIPVYGLGLQPDGRPFFAMKLVKGRTLGAILKDTDDLARARPRLLGIFERVCQAVAYAHARGVIHRDLKPGNVLVGAFGEVHVVDWGFAKVLGRGDEPAERPEPERTIITTVRSEEGSSHSVAGSVMGTPAYMPPEQALGYVDDLDERSDVFSLGAILAEILTGKPPYLGEQKDLLVFAAQARLDEAHARLDECGADPDVVALVKACLSPGRGGRPDDAADVAEALAAFFAEAEDRARRAEVEEAEARARAEEERAKVAREELRAEEERARAAKERAKAERLRRNEAEARRRAIREGRARRRTLAAAAALLVAIAIGAGSWLWLQSSRQARAERSAAAVARSMEEAALHLGREEWPEALAAARSGVDLARTGGADPETAGRAEALLTEATDAKLAAEKAAEQKRRDDEMLARLEEIRIRRSDDLDAARTDREYAEAFREYGVDVEALGPEEAGIRVAGAAIAVDLAAALDDWAWLRRAKRQLREKDPARLVAIARRADPDEWRNRLRDAADESDGKALLELAETADVEALPVRSLDLLGLSLEEAGERAAAVDLLRRAVHRHPSDFWLRQHLTNSLSKVRPRKHAEALVHATAALALRPKAPGIWSSIAVARAGLGEWEEARSALEEALRLKPETAWVVFEWAQALVRDGRLEEAVKEYQRAIDRDPTYHPALNNLCATFHEVGRFDEALEAARGAVRLAPEIALYHNTLGCALSGLRRFEEAERAHRKALELDPEHVGALVGLGVTLINQGHHAEALTPLERAVELSPDRANAPPRWISSAGRCTGIRRTSG
ncbi:MAG: protein kinase domain-containing protein, partial [Planctomycetota bacterium]